MIRHSSVAITGIGCICAAGLNLEACMKSLFEGKRNPVPPVSFSSHHPISYPVFEIHEDNFFSNSVKESNKMRSSMLALTAAREAISDAGWNREMLHEKKVGVCMGTTVGVAINNEQFYREIRNGTDPDMSPIKTFLLGNVASIISKEFGISGPTQTIVNACSSGTDAIGIAASWIRAGICDVVISGGADQLCRATYNGFISLKITDDEPCKPFDVKRKGLNLGEGAGVMILESENSFRKRNKKPRAFISGYSSVCDGYNLTTPHPDGKGLKMALAEALETSGLNPSDIAFINAHGTGTPDNDRIESKIFAQQFPGVPFYSTKGYTGHALGAAGAIEAAFTVASLEQGLMPKSIGFDTPDPELPASPISEITPINGHIAISESLGFGGQNAVLIFKTESG